MPDTNTECVAEICLYGTQTVGAGWLAAGHTSGGTATKLLGSNDPVKGRTFTMAIWLALTHLRDHGVRGNVRIYAPDGARYSEVPMSAVPAFGDLKWTMIPEVD